MRYRSLGVVLLLAALPIAARADTLTEALRACDKRTFAAELKARSYRCYMPLAHKHGYGKVLPHIGSLIAKHPGDPGLLLVRARMNSNQGKEAAIADFRAGAAGLAKLGRYDPAVKGFVDLARFYFRKKRVTKGRAALAEAGKLAASAGDPVLVAIVDISRAMHMLQSADVESARKLAAGALAKLPPQQKVARSLALYALTRASYRMDRLRDALGYAHQLSDVLRQRGSKYSLAATEEQRISISFELRAAMYEPDLRRKYIDALEGLIDQAESAGNLGLAADSLRELYLVVPEDRAAAVEKRALAAATRIGDKATLLRLRWIKTDRAVTQGDATLSDTLAELRAIEAEAAKLEDEWIVLDCMFTRAVALWEAGQHDRAWRAFNGAFAAIEKERDAETSSRAARGVFARRLGQYNAAAGRMMNKPDWQQRALAVIERARGRQLLAARRAFGGATRAPPKLPTVPEIQAALGAKEALVSFFIGAGADTYRSKLWWGGSGAAVVTKHAFSSVRLPDESVLVPAIDAFLGSILARDGGDVVTGPALYALLLAPVVANLPAHIEHVTIVGDGALHRLPLGALRSSANAEPLGMRYEFGYVPSIALWLELRGQRGDSPMRRALLALANPTLDAVPAPKGAVGFRAASLAPLPGGLAEGRYAVGRIGGGSLLRSADDASERFLKSSEARAYSMFHIAAHAVLNSRWPERSALMLAAEGTDDGRVGLEEFAKLDLRGRVVVLAACESADGNVVAGEGPISLARAGFVGGAQSLVASLWPLRDDEALALFRSFYRHLDHGLPIGKALAKAKRDLQRAGAPAAAWAGVVVMGDGAPRFAPRAGAATAWLRRPAIGAGLAGVGVLAVGLVFSLAMRRRRSARSA